MTSTPKVWDGVLRRLSTQLPRFAFEAWFAPLVAQCSSDELKIFCPTPFHRKRMSERFLPLLQRCCEESGGRHMTVVLCVAETRSTERAIAALPPSQTPAEEQSNEPAALQSDAATRETRRAKTPQRLTGTANPQPGKPLQRELAYRFSNFVVGSCNALAREACLAVARGSHANVNPLYIAASSGLGKTHLARAAAAEAFENTGLRTRYVGSEIFTNELLRAIREKRTDQFKRRFRQDCDLLVLEDVQFFRGKRSTQLELFHTVSHLLDAGCRVLLTGDCLPREIADFDPRLGSTLASGLVAEMETPDAEVRRAILRAKAAAGGVRLPEDCLERLIGSVRGNVRDLEGALIQLVTTASLLKRPIDLELTEAALRKVAPEIEPQRRLEWPAVTTAVAAFFKTTPDVLASRSRRREILVPRQLAMYLCRRYTDASLSEIGRAFQRDLPAVKNAIATVERAALERAPLRYQLEALAAHLDALVEKERRGLSERGVRPGSGAPHERGVPGPLQRENAPARAAAAETRAEPEPGPGPDHQSGVESRRA